MRFRREARGITSVARVGLARIMVLIMAVSLAGFPAPASADHDDDGKKEHRKESRRDKDKHGEKKPAAPAVPAGAATAYAQECGACHHAYYPGLLPARSWEKLLANPGEHFGESLPLSGAVLDEVRAYLAAGAADVAGNKRSRKIMKSIGSGTPLRISEIAYLRGKHHDLSSEVFKRPSVGGLANCIACHKGASAGDFDDDSAVIPN